MLNSRYRIRYEQEAARIEACIDVGSVCFADAFGAFTGKYIVDYRLNSSTAQLLRQRRLSEKLGSIQGPKVTHSNGPAHTADGDATRSGQ